MTYLYPKTGNHLITVTRFEGKLSHPIHWIKLDGCEVHMIYLDLDE